MTLVLRKSFDKYSAGTIVTPVTQPGKTRNPLTVEASYTHVTSYVDWAGNRQYEYERRTEVIDVPTNLLVELRNRTDMVPAISRSNRPNRKARQQLYRMLNPNEQ